MKILIKQSDTLNTLIEQSRDTILYEHNGTQMGVIGA